MKMNFAQSRKYFLHPIRRITTIWEKNVYMLISVYPIPTRPNQKVRVRFQLYIHLSMWNRCQLGIFQLEFSTRWIADIAYGWDAEPTELTFEIPEPNYAYKYVYISTYEARVMNHYEMFCWDAPGAHLRSNNAINHLLNVCAAMENKIILGRSLWE